MARRWFVNLSCVVLLASCQSLSTGDLLFHVVEKGNAITDVTPGMIDHVAIVISKDSVIEAVGAGVKTTPLDSLRQQEGYYQIGKVRGADPTLSVANARRFLGRPYDRLYLPDNEADAPMTGSICLTMRPSTVRSWYSSLWSTSMAANCYRPFPCRFMTPQDASHPTGNSSTKSRIWRCPKVGQAAILVNCRSVEKCASKDD